MMQQTVDNANTMVGAHSGGLRLKKRMPARYGQSRPPLQPWGLKVLYIT